MSDAKKVAANANGTNKTPSEPTAKSSTTTPTGPPQQSATNPLDQMPDYEIPAWASKPPNGCHLDVVKGDQLIQVFAL
ncbi:unnamed protein product [Anisakis simplex]|uniref:Cytochrome b5 heme-binding domain-containing protein n=1 Tax=Anisakis simplex TaxID=6269 RepID=A0A0M3J8I6_ANISI|nr:unnamed protein product [Anisakis simplex]